MKILATPIDAVVIFTKGFKPKPYRFKYINSQEQLCNIKVDKIISIETKKIAGIQTYIYVCQSQIQNKIYHYELKYIINNCTWELYKM